MNKELKLNIIYEEIYKNQYSKKLFLTRTLNERCKIKSLTRVL